MRRWAKNNVGFTIVELLIVIIVIAILAAISTVAYNGVQGRARGSQVAVASSNAQKAVELYYQENGNFPATLADAGVAEHSDVTFAYSVEDDGSYCIGATSDSDPDAVSTINSDGSDSSCSGDGEGEEEEEPPATTPGQLAAKYYNNTSFSGTPTLDTTVSTLDFDWGGGSPGGGINNDNFSAEWSGYLTPTISGNYTFRYFADDDQQLLIGGTAVINQMPTAGCCQWRTAYYTLTANVTVPIQMRFIEYGGGAAARVLWIPPGQSEQAIPSSVLSF